MSNFQYVIDGHTLLSLDKSGKNKVKVSHGEIVDIPDGVYTEARLYMAGFRRVNVANITDVPDMNTESEEAPEDEKAIETEAKEDNSDEITVEVENTETEAEKTEEEAPVEEEIAPKTDKKAKKK